VYQWRLFRNIKVLVPSTVVLIFSHPGENVFGRRLICSSNFNQRTNVANTVSLMIKFGMPVSGTMGTEKEYPTWEKAKGFPGFNM